MKPPKKMSLYPSLVPSVGIDMLDPSDLEVLRKLAHSAPPAADGTLGSVVAPRVAELSGVGFVILETGSQYSGKVRRMMLNNWAKAGAGEMLLTMLASCQSQLMPRLSIEKGGMVPDFKSPPKIGKLGTGKLSHREVRHLLESLKICHRDYWPIAQLANIVRPFAKATRRRS